MNMNLLDVLCHRVESGLILHGRGIVPTEKIFIRILLKEVPAAVIIGEALENEESKTTIWELTR